MLSDLISVSDRNGRRTTSPFQGDHLSIAHGARSAFHLMRLLRWGKDCLIAYFILRSCCMQRIFQTNWHLLRITLLLDTNKCSFSMILLRNRSCNLLGVLILLRNRSCILVLIGLENSFILLQCRSFSIFR